MISPINSMNRANYIEINEGIPNNTKEHIFFISPTNNSLLNRLVDDYAGRNSVIDKLKLNPVFSKIKNKKSLNNVLGKQHIYQETIIDDGRENELTIITKTPDRNSNLNSKLKLKQKSKSKELPLQQLLSKFVSDTSKKKQKSRKKNKNDGKTKKNKNDGKTKKNKNDGKTKKNKNDGKNKKNKNDGKTKKKKT